MNYLIALSGGADSVALLLKMLEAGNVGAAAHCNFHLRGGESDRDEAFVRRLCEERQVRLFVRHFDTRREASDNGESVEMAARRLRYDWFGELCRMEGFDAVAVAHHREDNAETILLNLVRGAGLYGLTGMKANKSGVVRPLLDLSRRDIIDYLRKNGQTYVTDSTNADVRYKRNAIRHEVLPLLAKLNPQVVQALNETGHRLSQVECVYRIGLNHLYAEMVSPCSDGIVLNADKLLCHPAALTLMHEWLAPYGFSAAQQEDALKMRIGSLLEAGGWMLTRVAGRFEMRRSPQKVEEISVPDHDGIFYCSANYQVGVRRLAIEEMGEFPRDFRVAVMDASLIRGQLILRSVEVSDRFVPLGMKGTKLVSDYLTDRHRSRIDKLGALVVSDTSGIVWLVNERIDQRVAIRESTQQIIMLYTCLL